MPIQKFIDEAVEVSEPPRPLVREIRPADPFPLKALGRILGAATEAIHDRVQAPLAICANSVLSVATLVMQGHADVVLPIGSIRAKPLSSYFVTIAFSGERKTECDYQAARPIREHERKLGEKYDQEIEMYRNDKAAWDKTREELIRKNKGSRNAIRDALNKLGSPPRAPLEPMLTSTEPTYEGLCKQFSTHQGSLGIFSSEGGQFIGGHGLKPEHKLGTASNLSALWDGEPARRVRAGDGASIFPGRRLALHLMVQPDVATILFTDPLLLGQGLPARILVAAPGSAAGTRMPRPEKPDTGDKIERYGATLLKALEQPAPTRSGRPNELAPRPVPLSDEARDRWRQFVGHIEGEIGAGGALEPIKGLANKLPEHAARLAGVIALVEDIDTPEINVQMLDCGIALAEYYASEALRIFESSRVNADILLAKRLLDWMHNSWPESVVALPDIYQRSLNAISDKATAAKLVATLVDHGWLVPIAGGAVVAGVHRREVWQIVKV